MSDRMDELLEELHYVGLLAWELWVFVNEVDPTGMFENTVDMPQGCWTALVSIANAYGVDESA